MEVNSVVYFASDMCYVTPQVLGTQIDQLLALGSDHCILLNYGSIKAERVFDTQEKCEHYVKAYNNKFKQDSLERKAKLPFLLRWLEWQ